METRTVTLKPGVRILTRFGMAWELLGEVDAKGYVKARRLEDGVERDIHTSDIKCIETAPPAKE